MVGKKAMDLSGEKRGKWLDRKVMRTKRKEVKLVEMMRMRSDNHSNVKFK